MKPRPKELILNKESGHLLITWQDDKQCRYPISHLREACPCVECRGGHQNMGAKNAPDNLLQLLPKRSYGVEKLEVIGNYALQFTWDDGHTAGIYTWDYLYQLCPEEQPNA